MTIISSQMFMAYIRPIRRSGRPGKQLVWFWLGEDLRRLKPVRDVIDAACGEMTFRRLFEGASYTGIDLDAERLRRGRARFPDAQALCSAIDEVGDGLDADLVICLQTIGINRRFEERRVAATIEALVRMTRPKGTLIFNAQVPRQQKAAIDRMLSEEFAVVRKRRYGDLPLGLTLPVRLSMVCAAIMKYFPLLRGNRRAYFQCSMRRAASAAVPEIQESRG